MRMSKEDAKLMTQYWSNPIEKSTQPSSSASISASAQTPPANPPPVVTSSAPPPVATSTATSVSPPVASRQLLEVSLTFFHDVNATVFGKSVL